VICIGWLVCWVVLCEVQNLGGVCSSQLSALSSQLSASALALCVVHLSSPSEVHCAALDGMSNESHTGSRSGQAFGWRSSTTPGK
jgi:hypothetical protein